MGIYPTLLTVIYSDWYLPNAKSPPRLPAMPCFHIIERYQSMRSGPAVKRCYGSRKVAEVTRKRGVTGDRADYYLDPSGRWAWWLAMI